MLRDIGITQIGLLVDFGSLAQEDIMRSLRIFADQALPRVRDILRGIPSKPYSPRSSSRNRGLRRA